MKRTQSNSKKQTKADSQKPKSVPASLDVLEPIELKKKQSHAVKEEEKVPHNKQVKKNGRSKSKEEQKKPKVQAPLFPKGSILLIADKKKKHRAFVNINDIMAEDKAANGHIYIQTGRIAKNLITFKIDNKNNQAVNIQTSEIQKIVQQSGAQGVAEGQEDIKIHIDQLSQNQNQNNNQQQQINNGQIHQQNQNGFVVPQKQNQKKDKVKKNGKKEAIEEIKAEQSEEEVKVNGKQKKRSKSQVKKEPEMIKAAAPAKRQRRARSIVKENEDQKMHDEEEEKKEPNEEVEQINTNVNDEMNDNEEEKNEQPKKKREKKASAKAKKPAKPKAQPVLPREDVEIPKQVETLYSESKEPLMNCCQTCSNRNCVRAVNINDVDLFINCSKFRAQISSLIEHVAPETRYSALEKAIALNRIEILEVLLEQDKPESEYRMKKKAVQIVKFETGDVSDMAFGVKVRKVNMMRGNRQGNNAFLEDPVQDKQTPAEVLLSDDEFSLVKAFQTDSVKKETLEVIQKSLGKERFQQFIDKAIPVMMKHGCYKALVALFEIFGHNGDLQNSFFNPVFYYLLTAEKNYPITALDLQQVRMNQKASYAHIAALNPSGKALLFLIDNGHEFDVTINKQATAHFAAVCNADVNLKILVEKEIDLHDADDKKRTPLMWALESQKGVDNIKTILENIQKGEKDFKDESRQMAIHYLCKYGISQRASCEEIMDLFMTHRAKFSQQGGWNKYTPLIYACTYGNFEIAEYIIEKVPRININKGDKYDRTPLLMACRNGHANIAALLIKHHADIDKPDTSGNTPLHHASAYGWIECVRVLLKYGANPSAENAWKSTPITIALQKNHLAVVKELLETQELNVDSKDDEGRTILTLALANINNESIQFIDNLITNKNADVNTQDAKGRTPLYHLVFNMSQSKGGLFQDNEEREFKILKILLSAGANLNIKAKDGKSPFTIAFENGMTELLRLFGKNIDLNEDPSLFFAFSGVSVLKKNVHNLLMECLTAKRVEDESINHVNDQGFTPILYYINECINLKDILLIVIENMVQKKEKHILNETIIEKFEKNPNHQNAVVSKEAHRFFAEQIIDPFIEFLQVLIDNGANPNAYVLKLKQWRDEVPLSSTQNQMSQLSTQTAAQLLARRPPEKDQYISEALGLCNAIHLLLDNPIKELFDFLLQIKGIQFNQVNFQKMSPFFKLVKTKDIKNNPDYKYCFDQLLLTGQVDIDSPDQYGMSAFWFFYTNNRFDDAFYLVGKGANINHIDNYGVFALKRELFANNYNMLKQLLEKGADPNMSDEFQRTILHLACDFSHRRDYKEHFRLFMKHKASISQVDFKLRTPLHYMFVKKNRRSEVNQFDPLNLGLDILLNQQSKNHFDINSQDINGKTILHYAAQRGSTESLEYIIKLYGKEAIQFNIEDKFQNTPLSVAINHRHMGFAEKLLDILDQEDLKGFIYQEPNRRNNNANANAGGNLMFGGGMNNQQDDEQSDMEYMQIQLLDQGLINLDGKNKKQKRDDNAVNLFRYIIRNNLGPLEKIFIEKGYDKIQMVVDYICEGQINKLFQVIETHFKNHTGAKGSILIQKNDKQQNLIHVLARNAHLMKDITEMTKFYKQLKDEGVSPDDTDYKGRTALHLAIKSGNFHFIKYLVDVEKFDINAADNNGANAIGTLLKGDRILKASDKILQYLLERGANPNQLYKEEMYQALQKDNKDQEEEKGDEHNNIGKYKCTPVIHAIRHESKDRSNIRLILKQLLLKADPSTQDSDGKDPFFYSVIRNHTNTFEFMVDTIEMEHKSYDPIKKDQVDKEGKSLIHYIVNPLSYGSYENDELLRKAIKIGFKHDIKDKSGKTPYQYALLQKSGVMKITFEEVIPGISEQNKGDQQQEEQAMNIDDLLADNNNQQPVFEVDFEHDAQLYLQDIQMQIDPHKYVPCDPSGKFNDDCVVMYDDDTEQHFDVYLTRVEIGKFQPGGDYLFYKMQLVLDKSRDLAILLTRWGRIGEEGAFQKTPFNSHEEAISEFRKIFEQKTNNKWCHKDKFQKRFRKFQLMRTNYVTIDQKNYLMNFNLDQAPDAKYITKDSLNVLREICDVNTYLKALQNSGVDPKAMPFSNLDRKNLYDALDVLIKLQKTLEKLEGMNPRPYAENERNKLLSLREKMWYLSSRFYEFIPHEEFRNKMVPPISNVNLLMQKSAMIQNLIQIEMASKILLGAHYKQDKINPLEYCMMAAGVQFEVLERMNPEYRIIHEYATNTYVDQIKLGIQNIIRLNKEADNKKYKHDLDNKILLFHGSKLSNFLGILGQGLRVQPMEVQRNGSLLGKGIYFSDMVSKSIQYTHDANAPHHSSKFVIVCEVALGNIKELTRHNGNYKLEEGYQSVQGMGRQGPDMVTQVTLPDGAMVPLGRIINYNGKENSDFQFNEYVVPDCNQVRMRYLIQFK